MTSQNSVNNTVQDNDFSVNRATAGTTVQSSVDHSDNTSTTSHAKFLSQVGGTAGGDPHVNFNVSGVQNYAFGIDNTDSDNLKLTDGAGPSSGSTYITFDQASTNVWLDGISFDSGTNVMANYEEGTWTPSITFGGGSTGLTVSTQIGRYTKIGRIVMCMFNLTLTSKGTSTGAAVLTGLPITVTAPIGGALGALRPQVLNFSANFFSYYAVPNGATTTASFQQAGDNNAFINLLDTNFNNNTAVGGLIIYSS